MKRSLRSKLLLQYTALVLVCMLVIPAFVAGQMGRQFHKFSAERFAEDRQQLVEMIQGSIVSGNNGKDLQNEILRWPVVSAKVYGADGAELFELRHVSHRRKTGTAAQRGFKGRLQTETVELLAGNGTKIGSVKLEILPFKISREGFFLKKFKRNLELWIVIMLVLAALFAVYMTEKIIRPVLEAAKRAEMISKGNFPAEKSAGSDIKEIQQLTDSVDRLGCELAEQENLRRRLMSDIAHELRNPVTVVKAHLEAFEDGVWEPTHDRIALTRSEIDRLSLLIKEVEKLTALEKADTALVLSNTDLSLLAEECAQSFDPLFENKGVELKREIDKGAELVLDAAKIRQVMENLLSNALRYTDKGGTVLLSLKKHDGRTELFVKDSGIGISAEDLPNVFERFYRTDKSRARESGGMGIGLAVVKAIVEAHGAKIRAESSEGKGSCFTIVFEAQKYCRSGAEQ